MNGGKGFLRGPFYEGLLKIAPLIILVFVGFIVAALVENFVQDRLHPEMKDRHFDPVKNFSHVNSAGMVKVLLKRSDEADP